MKVGIITHYYKSLNYGGNLQAYALCKYLNLNGHKAEQICFVNTQKRKITFKSIVRFAKRKVGKLFFNQNDKFISSDLQLRKNSIFSFNQQRIPHSDVVYNSETIYSAEEKYDVFITGSDQVWHPLAVNDAYLLKFVKNKPKISYAASLAVSELSDSYKQRLKEELKDYLAISVRENNAVDLLKPLEIGEVSVTVDPVFLLDKTEWNELSSSKIITDKYVFCYFLGDNAEARRVVDCFAKRQGLKIVTMPYLEGKFRSCDRDFGDEKIFEATPNDFLSLIRYAEYVFTDSFHALSFSLIFEKQFFVFNRTKTGMMNSRIYSLLSLVSLEERFFDKEIENFAKKIENFSNINYANDFLKLEELKDYSKNFLTESLKRAE